MRRISLCLLILLLLGLSFGVLAPAPSVARDFKQALPGYRFQFPRDHAAHEAYKTEWWYYTGHLQTAEGKRYGYELTFFRVGTDTQTLAQNPKWTPGNLYMTHFAVSDETNKRFFHTQKFNRQAPGGKRGRAGALSSRYQVWNENWQVTLKDGVHHLSAKTPQYTLTLQLKPTKPPAIHGQNGVSQKASCKGCASHYYSLTRMATTGTLVDTQVSGKGQPVTGVTWMDQEFGSNQLTAAQTGWDWVSVQLANNTELMVYLLRRKDSTVEPSSGGTFVDAAGRTTHLPLKAIRLTPTGRWKSPHSGGTYPMGWRVQVPRQQLDLTLTPAFEDQELYSPWLPNTTYWEGSCRVRGTAKGKPTQGEAYVEMTGYARPFKERL